MSAELHEELGVARGEVPRADSSVALLRRRISYFMLFRLVLLSLFTLGLGSTHWLSNEHAFGMPRDWIGLLTVAAGYIVTLVSAWLLRAERDVLISHKRLRTIAWAQSAFDIMGATIVVALSESLESSSVFLFLIAVLGAATMGHRRQIVTVASASGLFYVAVTLAQISGALAGLAPLPASEAVPLPAVPPGELWVSLLRSLGVIGLVAGLSSYLNTQLLSSDSQAKILRTLNENILRSLSSGLVTVDQQGTVLFANPTAGQLLGHSGSLYGRDCEELLPGLRSHLDDSGGLRNRFELNLVHPSDNRETSIGLSCSPLLDEHGQFLGHIVNFQDVTELREMEQVLRRSERLAAIGTLAASVAHEVRNPLAAISGCAELLDTTDVNEEDQRLIKVIRSETARLADIVTELLDYTRPRALMRAPIDLASALLELADSFRADPTHTNIDLVVDVPKARFEVEVDISQLTQVLWNLVRNAAQAMEGDGRVELNLHARGKDMYELAVRDHGMGIAREDIERIFEPFFSTKSGGTGIGLALVHRIIDEHGGVIKVESELDVGTCFTLLLPRRAQDAES